APGSAPPAPPRRDRRRATGRAPRTCPASPSAAAEVAPCRRRGREDPWERGACRSSSNSRPIRAWQFAVDRRPSTVDSDRERLAAAAFAALLRVHELEALLLEGVDEVE